MPGKASRSGFRPSGSELEINIVPLLLRSEGVGGRAGEAPQVEIGVGASRILTALVAQLGRWSAGIAPATASGH